MVNNSASLMEITLKGGDYLPDHVVVHYSYVDFKTNSLNEETNDEI